MKKPLKQEPKKDIAGRRFDDQPVSTGRRIELYPNDFELLKFYHRHGDLPVTLAFEYLKAMGMAKSQKATTQRHTKLFHEDNTEYGGTYLDRDPRQFETRNSKCHHRVYRLTPRSEKALRDNGFYSEWTPKTSSSWKHDFLRACYTASIEIACLRESDKYEYLSHEKIATAIEKDSFSVEGKKFTPDAVYGIRYKETGKVLLFLVEIDCMTEQVKSTQRNPYRTFENKLETYRKYISGGLYKNDFNISGGVMLAVVTTSYGHMHSLLNLVKNPTSYMLFNMVDEFYYGFKPPREIFPLFNESWLRPHSDDFLMNNPS